MAADHSGDYHKGEMDIHEQAATFDMFTGMAKWGSLVIAVGLLFFTVWFAVKGAGFIPAAISAFVVAVVGFLALKKGANAH
ncbi:aa3-type cytochrome c oxidase subunit IV [Asticcacaulis sp. BYS171W]|uniref:Aa3-type cytochrome c oxidase subunit IV n=1 Tax=Asticcacaulis aquaticus TaxID=2984212 RepID=A0ABT5HTY5_9CAUL|nr:aa3-type cytochrome c oxidase subunit IV [Asticcacaulis aquaticus]MDC7683509.1 aa3-type cytochrome c oxidase subunit IV [Asticcacaulis aquaticus]